MNIKDPRVAALARELAGLRGTSATAAVREALEHDLTRVRQEREAEWEEVARLQDEVATTSHLWVSEDELYDADGLPR